MSACVSPVCDRTVHARGMCVGHYVRWCTTGDARLDTPIGTRATGPYLSFEPVAELARQRFEPVSHHVSHIGDIGIVHTVTGITRRRLYTWRDRGLTIAAADEVADLFRVHPSELWPDYYEVAA